MDANIIWALDTLEQAIMRETANTRNQNEAKAAMALLAFVLGNLEKAATSLETMAKHAEREGLTYQRGFAAGVAKGDDIG